MAFTRPTRGNSSSSRVALCAIAVAASGSFFLASTSFAAGSYSPKSAILANGPSQLFAGQDGLALQRVEQSSRIPMHASGPVPMDSNLLRTPKGFKIKLMRKMPSTRLRTEEIMQRIVTVLVRNMMERFREAPIKTVDLMKTIGLRGHQIKSRKYITKALNLLMAQKVIYKYKQNPKRWEIHEEYRKYGVPPVSWDRQDPWKYCHLIKFWRTSTPMFGPAHGLYRPQDKEFMKAWGIPLGMIQDRRVRPDPYDAQSFKVREKKGFVHPSIMERVGSPGVDKFGNPVTFDWEAADYDGPPPADEDEDSEE
eukprot:TRINITY_DN22946_c0_g1_i1.p1 TRINITY_DN22946_c0_g1~~TRINITY_DN22946_c0_g1_i1.p1  ORF type:complete len:342 (-),score=51.03 TRINITY_DN22946_c0_g1_i1:207-1133(-)